MRNNTYTNVHIKRKLRKLNKKEQDLICSKSPYISEEENQWINYVKMVLYSIWALHDKKYHDYRGNVRKPIELVFSLVKDIDNFKIDNSFTSTETQIWNLFRIVTIARINKSLNEVASILSSIKKFEESNILAFSKPLKIAIFSAKLECYLSAYNIIDSQGQGQDSYHNALADECIIGHKKSELLDIIIQSYSTLLRYIDEISSIQFNPDHSNFPKMPYLSHRVAYLVESYFLSENCEFRDRFIEKQNNTYQRERDKKDECFTNTGKKMIQEKIFKDINYQFTAYG